MKLKFKLKLKLNQILIIALTAVVLSGFVFSLSGTGALTRSEASSEEMSECCESIALPQVFRIISTSDCCDKTPNTMESFLAALGSGAGCMELNIVFNSEGTPVLAKSREFVNERSLPLEEVLKKVKQYERTCLMLNLIEFSNIPELYSMIYDNELTRRIYISGIDSEHMPYLSSQMPEVMFVFDVDEKADLDDPEICKTIVSDAFSTGISALRCKTQKVTQCLVDAVRNYSPLSLFLTDADSERQMYAALKFNPDGIMTSDPEKLLDLIIDNNFFDR